MRFFGERDGTDRWKTASGTAQRDGPKVGASPSAAPSARRWKVPYSAGYKGSTRVGVVNGRGYRLGGRGVGGQRYHAVNTIGRYIYLEFRSEGVSVSEGWGHRSCLGLRTGVSPHFSMNSKREIVGRGRGGRRRYGLAASPPTRRAS